jgi:tetratricopeptide (TPR) repeat protein
VRPRRARPGGAALTAPVAALLLGVAALSPPSDAARAVRAWLEGEAEDALAALERLPASRERDLNRGVVLLHSGQAERAERTFLELRAREARWLPGLRWLARAQDALRRPEALDAAAALLGSRGASGRDHFWAAQLYAERGELERAREGFRRAVAEEDDLYLAWLGLAGVEQRLGHPEAARAARAKAAALHPGDASPELPRAPPLPAGRPLRYRAKYLPFRIATVTLAEGGRTELRGRPARLLTLQARSNPAFFFLHIDSEWRSFIGADGTMLAHRNLSDDSTTGRRQAAIDTDREAETCTVRQVQGGIFAYEVLPLPPRAHDGVSMLESVRAAARVRGSLSVIRVVDATWKGTSIRAAGVERIQWRGRRVDAVRVEVGITRGTAAGVAGTVEIWISADEEAIPYRARMKAPLGSVTLELMPEGRESDEHE